MQELQNVLDHYNINNVLKTETIKNGNICNIFKIDTINSDYILRIRPKNFIESNIEKDHEFLNYLSDNLFFSPKVIKTKNDKSYVKNKEGLIAELHSYIPHNKTIDDFEYQEISNQLAITLGNYHKISSKFPKEINKKNKTENLPTDFWTKYFDGPLKIGIQRYYKAANSENVEKNDVIIIYTNYLKDILEKIKIKLEKNLYKIPKLINHNDFYGNNILFLNNKINGIVDFDFCCTGIHYIDLVELIHGSLIWNNEHMKYWGLDPEGKIRINHSKNDLRLYFSKYSNYNFDFSLFKDFIVAKIISLAFNPNFDFVEEIDDRIEVLFRLKKTIQNINDSSLI
jgi:Ser/Thr protein kinase RdoA (MazF antagonist)